MSKSKKVLLTIITIILIIAFTPIFGSLYEKYFGSAGGGWIGPENPENILGFFISFILFFTLIVTIFGGAKKYKILGWSLGIALIITLIAPEVFIISLSTAIIAFILGQLILLIYNKIKK